LNLSVSNGGKVRSGVSIKTADDASYLAPIKHYLSGKGWQDGRQGTQRHFTRTPGYGLYCLPFYKLFNEKTALKLIVITQCLWIALIAGLLYLMFLRWKIPDNFSMIAALVFGLIPSFSGYVFYTLTEGLTPVVIFALFFMYVFSKKASLALITASAIAGYLILLRPAFASFTLLLLPLFLSNKMTPLKRITSAIVAIMLLFGPITAWEIRNHNLGKQFKGIDNLHSIYSPSNNSVWRAPHQAMYGFVKQFNINGQAYHTWNHQLESSNLENHLAIFDQQSITTIGRDTLSKYVLLYQQSITEIPLYSSQNKYSNKELLLVEKFTEFKNTYQHEHKFTSYVRTPSKVLKMIVWQSHLNLFQYWNTYSKTWWIKPFSLFTSLLHLSIYLLPLLYLATNKKLILAHWPLMLAMGLYLGYLVFIQRGLEQRYTYPLLPILFACSVWVISKLIGLFKSRDTSNVGSGNE